MIAVTIWDSTFIESYLYSLHKIYVHVSYLNIIIQVLLLFCKTMIFFCRVLAVNSVYSAVSLSK